MHASDKDQLYIATDEASRLFRLSHGYLANLRVQKKGCPFFKVGKRVLYRFKDFERWVTQGKV
jgi:hypothetical protein